MTNKTLTLATLMLATTALTTGAEAGGVRLMFGGPLGMFNAHPHMSSGPGGNWRYNRHIARPDYFDEPSYRRIRRPVPVEVVDEAPARRVVKAKTEETSNEVKTAKTDDKSTTADSTPTIFIPESPPLTGTQSTPAPEHTAALAPTVVSKAEDTTTQIPVKQEPLKTSDVAPAAPETTAPAKSETADKDEPRKTGAMKKLCRRFSAAVAGLIDVPCGD